MLSLNILEVIKIVSKNIKLMFGILFISLMLSLSLSSAVVWNSTKSFGLTRYWAFNEASGAIKESVFSLDNGTAMNGIIQGDNGILGKAINSTGSDDYVNLTTGYQFTDSGWSVNGWMYVYSGTQAKFFMADSGCGQNYIFSITDTNRYPSVGMCSVGADTSTFAVGTGAWSMVTYVMNDSDILFYINGVFKDKKTRDLGAVALPSRRLANNHDTNLGAGFLLDELGIWNRTLQANEIDDLWNGGAGLVYVPDVAPSISNITLNAPVDNYISAYSLVTFNCSASDTIGVLNLTLVLDGIFNQTINGGVNQNLSLQTIKNVALGNHNWTCYSCFNNSCEWSTENRTLTISKPPLPTIIYPKGLNYAYNVSTLNYSVLSPITLSACWYSTDGGVTNSTPTTCGTNFTEVPSIEGINTWTLFANNTDNLVNYTRVSFYRLLNGINISNSSCTNLGYSFTIKDEVNFTILGGLIDYNFNFSFNGGNAQSVFGTTSNKVFICYNTTAFPNLTIDFGELKYYVTGYQDRWDYVFSNVTMNNNSLQNISLYSLETTKATSFLFTITSGALSPYKDKYLAMLRWYPAENTYNVVEMGKTDDKGQTILRLKTEDVYYRFGVYEKNGVLIKLTDPIKMICQANPCTYTIYIDEPTLDLTSIYNVQSNLSWNNNTKVFTYIWNDLSGKTTSMNLSVWKDTGMNSTLICTTTGTGITNVITCNVSAYTGILRAEVYRTASPEQIIEQLIENVMQTIVQINDAGKKLGLLFGAGLVVLLALIGVFNPIIAVIMGVIALIPLLAIGSIPLAVFTGFAVLAGIVLHFLRRIA